MMLKYCMHAPSICIYFSLPSKTSPVRLLAGQLARYTVFVELVDAGRLSLHEQLWGWALDLMPDSLGTSAQPSLHVDDIETFLQPQTRSRRQSNDGQMFIIQPLNQIKLKLYKNITLLLPNNCSSTVGTLARCCLVGEDCRISI